MTTARRYLLGRLVAGTLIVAPMYLAVLLLAQAVSSMIGVINPLISLLPEGLRSEKLVAILLVMVLCLVVGMFVGTRPGQALQERLEQVLVSRLPGYSLFRSLMQRIAGESREQAWTPALVEIEEALVPGFIIEELEDGRYTVFVPSVPTPLAGAVYVLERGRVHPVDIPFTQAIKVVSRWGQGAGEMVKAMEREAAARASRPGDAGAPGAARALS